MQKIDIEYINFSLETQFHVLFHFNVIDESYREKMISQGFTKEMIDHQLNEDRSKFDSEFAANPHMLWQKLERQIELGNYQLISSPGKKVLIFSFENQYVGKDNIYKLPEPLVDDELNAIENHIVKIHGTPIETNQINCILRKVENHLEVITIFPGVYAPPFPDQEKQSGKEYSESQAFWTTHAIIINQ